MESLKLLSICVEAIPLDDVDIQTVDITFDQMTFLKQGLELAAKGEVKVDDAFQGCKFETRNDIRERERKKVTK